MNSLDDVLERYERDLTKVDKGECEKIIECVEFRDHFRAAFRQEYGPKLDEVRKKLINKNHRAEVEESLYDGTFYSFSLAVIPRHLFRFPVDRYYPHSLWSTLSFIANEHTLTVDIETMVRPSIEILETTSVEKIPKDEFSSDSVMEKVCEFLERIFDETIIMDFKGRE